MQFLVISTLFFGIFTVFSIFSNNNTSAASIELTVPTNFNIDLDPGVGTTFGESSNQQISIKTSGSFGYTLNIKPSDGTNLKNTSNVIKTITKAEGYDNSDSYKSSDEVNTWAYKPGKLSSVANTKYLPFPSVETLLDKTDKNNDTANNYDLTIAAKVDNTLPSGRYSNNFVITATANTVSYSITYNLNEGEWSGESPQTGTVTENKIKLDSNTPTKENYEFLGWCSEPTTDENCNGETKQPGDEITLTNSDNQFTFYSIWKEIIPDMQSFNCKNIPVNQTITLKDSRDGELYNVKRISDGKCWMMNDLRIAEKHLTTKDSNLLYEFDLPNVGIGEGFGESQHVPTTYMQEYNGNQSGLYTWQAVAGLSNYKGVSSNNCQSGIIDNHAACSYSICPLVWKLPMASYGASVSSQINLIPSGVKYFGDGASTNSFPSIGIIVYTYHSNEIRTCHNSNNCVNGAVRVYWYGNSGATPSFGSANLVRCYTE